MRSVYIFIHDRVDYESNGSVPFAKYLKNIFPSIKDLNENVINIGYDAA